MAAGLSERSATVITRSTWPSKDSIGTVGVRAGHPQLLYEWPLVALPRLSRRRARNRNLLALLEAAVSQGAFLPGAASLPMRAYRC